MRQYITIAIVLLVLAGEAEARGMYCTRNRQTCAHRQDALRAEVARYITLTPEQRVVEDARSAKMAKIYESEWQKGVIARRKDAERDRANGMRWAIAIGVIIAMAISVFVITLPQVDYD